MSSWRTRAACLGEDPELFFPDPCQDRTAEEAKKVCAQCPVRAECLAEALSFEGTGVRAAERFGVWGETEPWERAGQSRPRFHEARCGTDGGYHRHMKVLHEPACGPCKEAHRVVAREGARRRRERMRQAVKGAVA